jgi:hypothetical protein
MAREDSLAPMVFDSRTWLAVSPNPEPSGWERAPRRCGQHLRQVLPKGCIRKSQGTLSVFFRSPWEWITAHELLQLAHECWKQGEGVRSTDGKLYHGGALVGLLLGGEPGVRHHYDAWVAARAVQALADENR